MLLCLHLWKVALWVWTTWSGSDCGGGFGSQSTFSSPLEDTGQSIGQTNGSYFLAGREREGIPLSWVNTGIDTVPHCCQLPGQGKAGHLQQVWG